MRRILAIAGMATLLGGCTTATGGIERTARTTHASTSAATTTASSGAADIVSIIGTPAHFAFAAHRVAVFVLFSDFTAAQAARIVTALRS